MRPFNRRCPIPAPRPEQPRERWTYGGKHFADMIGNGQYEDFELCYVWTLENPTEGIRKQFLYWPVDLYRNATTTGKKES